MQPWCYPRLWGPKTGQRLSDSQLIEGTPDSRYLSDGGRCVGVLSPAYHSNLVFVDQVLLLTLVFQTTLLSPYRPSGLFTMSNALSNTRDFYEVYQGNWINWSHGRMFGATITLNRRDAGLLIAFIALFVTLTGTAFWRIACFALHHYFSKEAPRDGLYHQRQAILRNSANGASGLCTLTQLVWAWRNHTHHLYRRLLPVVIFTILCLGAFATASIFSSKISTATETEVLVSSARGGSINLTSPDLDLDRLSTIYYPYLTQRQKNFANYALQCYTNASNPEECRTYIRKQLPLSVDRNASCPFSGEICKSTFGDIEIDSGFLNSNDDFGMNNPPHERFLYRNLLRCAPLITEGHKQPYNYSKSGGDTLQYMRYYYGDVNLPQDAFNFTYQYQIPSMEALSDSQLTSSSWDYNLQ